MLFTDNTQITTDGSGDATVYIGSRILGFLVSIKYSPGTIATTADLTITGETSGVPILTVTNAGTSDVVYYPRALPNAVADASAGTASNELIPLVNERIQVVVAQGGDTNTGTIEATYMTASPF